MKRLLLLLATVAAAAVLAGVYLPSNAVTAGSASVSRQSLDRNLAAIARSPDYACFLSEQRQIAGQNAAPLQGAGTAGSTATYGTAFADDWLESMVTDRVVDGEVASAGLTITSADVTIGREVLTRRMSDVLDQYAQDINAQTPSCGGNGQAVLDSLPGWFVTQQARAEAAQALLDARAVGSGLGDAALASYYAAHRASFDRYCVSFIVVKTQAAATAAQAAINGGTSFAQEAAAVSITGQTAANGGVAGCGILIGTIFGGRLTTTPVNGETTISAQGVWWLALVTKKTPQPLSIVRKNVITAILAAGQPSADKHLAAALRAAKVSVDPRFGQAGSGSVTLIRPPVLPPASSILSVPADVPTASPSR